MLDRILAAPVLPGGGCAMIPTPSLFAEPSSPIAIILGCWGRLGLSFYRCASWYGDVVVSGRSVPNQARVLCVVNIFSVFDGKSFVRFGYFPLKAEQVLIQVCFLNLRLVRFGTSAQAVASIILLLELGPCLSD